MLPGSLSRHFQLIGEEVGGNSPQPQKSSNPQNPKILKHLLQAHTNKVVGAFKTEIPLEIMQENLTLQSTWAPKICQFYPPHSSSTLLEAPKYFVQLQIMRSTYLFRASFKKKKIQSHKQDGLCQIADLITLKNPQISRCNCCNCALGLVRCTIVRQYFVGISSNTHFRMNLRLKGGWPSFRSPEIRPPGTFLGCHVSPEYTRSF